MAVEVRTKIIDGDGHIAEDMAEIVGNRPFLYSSDFPHEMTNDSCKHDIGELVESEELTMVDKEGILGRNAERLYGW